MLVRLEPGTPRSRVKHSTSEPLCSLIGFSSGVTRAEWPYDECFGLGAGLNPPLIVKLIIIYRHAQNILHNVEVSIVYDLGQTDWYQNIALD